MEALALGKLDCERVELELRVDPTEALQAAIGRVRSAHRLQGVNRPSADEKEGVGLQKVLERLVSHPEPVWQLLLPLLCEPVDSISFHYFPILT